jgi:hypothetical protein
MAFEWRRTGGQCTLKSRSLNGTVVQIPSEPENQIGEEVNIVIDGMPRKKEATHGDVFFALCLDYGKDQKINIKIIFPLNFYLSIIICKFFIVEIFFTCSIYVKDLLSNIPQYKT